MIELDETKANDLNELLAFADNFRNRTTFDIHFYQSQCNKKFELDYLFRLLSIAKFYLDKSERKWFYTDGRSVSATINTKSFLEANGFINILNKEIQEENIKNLTEKNLVNMDINQRKKNRFLFLEKMFKDSNGSENKVFSAKEVGQELLFSQQESRDIMYYLIDENLIKYYGAGDTIMLTHWGIKEIEQALENPTKPTEHFLPVNIINIGNMTNSSLQQATNNSIINVNFNEEKIKNLDDILDQLKNIQDTLDISIELHKELISEIQTLEIQRQSPKPKSIIIFESLKTIRSLLENVVANAITPKIIGAITLFLNHVEKH